MARVVGGDMIHWEAGSGGGLTLSVAPGMPVTQGSLISY